MKNPVASLDSTAGYSRPCSLAIGMFDGLHIGHGKVVAELKRMARATKSLPCVLTFSPHPSTVIPMGRPPAEMLCPMEERARMFAEAGAEKVFVKNFDLNFASLTPDEFVDFLRKKFPRLRAIVTGMNFVFGKKASGNFHTLEKICAENGWKYSAVKGVLRGDGKRISSSLLREAVRKADFAAFKKMSGYDYYCRGRIVGGKKIGRTLGFPTLNLPCNPACKPPLGVYAVSLVSAKGGRTRKGVANYGIAPTTGVLLSPVLETHLVDGGTRLSSGDEIKVKFLKFLRPEKKFASLDALKRQIAKDRISAEKYFSSI